ncbi:MAG: hypothetical protein ACKVRP_10420 [Bacteroidota bacterium]
MKATLAEHIFSILLVSCTMGAVAMYMADEGFSNQASHVTTIEPHLNLDSVNLNDPLHRALLKETLDIFRPGRGDTNDSIVHVLQRFRQEKFASTEFKSGAEKRNLSWATVSRLWPMYLQFILSYLVVMVLTYHAARSLAILRFVRNKQGRKSYLAEMVEHLRRPQAHNPASFVRILAFPMKAFTKAVAYTVLFAPAYVIAYSLRSGFDTDSFLFMIVLAVISNGLLITTTSKFYTFLIAESRKGYVDTAIVKNLNASYHWGTSDGISVKAVLRPGRLLPSHVFRHIYMNARFQHIPSLKEHGSFLITGLIIIEMALNIQGHLGYEMLQNILYKQYDVVLTIIVAIFLVVKATEIGVDVWFHREAQTYENGL